MKHVFIFFLRYIACDGKRSRDGEVRASLVFWTCSISIRLMLMLSLFSSHRPVFCLLLSMCESVMRGKGELGIRITKSMKKAGACKALLVFTTNGSNGLFFSSHGCCFFCCWNTQPQVFWTYEQVESNGT